MAKKQQEQTERFLVAPEVALLSANAAAFAALSGFWHDIPDRYSGNFLASLICFAFGIILATYGCYCRYLLHMNERHAEGVIQASNARSAGDRSGDR